MSVKVPVYGPEGQVREAELDTVPVKRHVLYEVVKWQLACRRRGTASTKTRSEVRGGGKKPWKQKGTGRARQGSIRSPLWPGGGKVFGPKPRDYSYTLPKRLRQQGLDMAISQRALDGKLGLVESFGPLGKTKQFVAWYQRAGLGQGERVLVVTKDELARRSVRNLSWATPLDPAGLNVHDILRHDRVLIDADVIEVQSGGEAA